MEPKKRKMMLKIIEKRKMMASTDSVDFRTKELQFAHDMDVLPLYSQRCIFLNNMRKQEIMCDVKIITKDDVTLKAHKLILVGASQFFYNMFSTTFDKDEVHIETVDSRIMKLILEYIYTSRILLTDENVEDVIFGADYLLIETLKHECSQYLIQMISVENVFHLRTLADTYTCETLLKMTGRFIVQNFKDIMKDEQFLNMKWQHVVELLRNYELNVPSERIVFNAIVRYIKHDIDNRKEYAFKLMRTVRFAFLGKQRLSQIARLEPLCGDISPVITLPGIQELLVSAFVEENILYGNLEDTSIKRVVDPRQSYLAIPKIYVIGGNSSPNIVKSFDIRREIWDSAPNPIRYVCRLSSTAVHFREKIYVMGGYDGNRQILPNVQIYNLETKLWTDGVTIPGNGHYYSTAVVLDENIYLMGGLEGPNAAKTCYRFSIIENEWSRINDLNEPRASASSAVMNGRIYIVGGCTGTIGSWTSLKSVEYYDPTEDRWTSLPAESEMPSARFNLGVVADELTSTLYAIGGKDPVNKKNICESYDSEKNVWTRLPDMKIGRCSHGTIIHDGFIYAIGGRDENKEEISSIEVFCTDSKKWFKLKKDLSTANSSACVVLAYENSEL